jgi:hypothetical protein
MISKNTLIRTTWWPESDITDDTTQSEWGPSVETYFKLGYQIINKLMKPSYRLQIQKLGSDGKWYAEEQIEIMELRTRQ